MEKLKEGFVPMKDNLEIKKYRKEVAVKYL